MSFYPPVRHQEVQWERACVGYHEVSHGSPFDYDPLGLRETRDEARERKLPVRICAERDGNKAASPVSG